MKRIGILCAFLLAFSGLVVAMQTMGEQIQQKAAAAKEAAALNQQALRAYSWITKTDISVKGEVKNTKIESCRYGPDGQVQKTMLTDPPEEEKKRGLRGRRARKKTAEMKEELEASAALVQSYVPPAAEKIQAVIAAGKVSASQAGPGAVALTFPDYNLSGDALTLLFDSEVKVLRKVSVDTWLDKHENKVTLEVSFESLPDGTNYPAATVLQIPEDNIEVRIENSNYQKVAQ